MSTEELLSFEWNSRQEFWEAHADTPNTGKDPAIGPAGPAGVSMLNAGNTTVNFCLMTGRVTDVYFNDVDEGDNSAALLDTILSQEDIDTMHQRMLAADLIYEDSNGENDIQLESYIAKIGRVATRLNLVRASQLRNVLQSQILFDQPYAESELIHELDVVLQEFKSVGGLPVTPHPFEDFIREIQMTRPRTEVMIPSLPFEETPAHKLYSSEAPAPDSADILNLDPVSSELLLGISVATVDHKNNWHVVQAHSIKKDDRAAAIWVVAKDENDAVVGAAQLRGMDDNAMAEIAVAPNVKTAKYQFISNPFNRPSNSVYAGRLDQAVDISRVAWIAKQTGDLEMSERLFGLAAKSWLYMGQTFRAAWAWSLSDRKQEHLEDLASLTAGVFSSTDLRTTLEVIEGTGDIPVTVVTDHQKNPDAVGALPSASWMYVVDLQKLVP